MHTFLQSAHSELCKELRTNHEIITLQYFPKNNNMIKNQKEYMIIINV